MSQHDKILLRKIALIETVNDDLKKWVSLSIRGIALLTILQRICFAGFIVYNLLPKKSSLNIEIINERKINA